MRWVRVGNCRAFQINPIVELRFVGSDQNQTFARISMLDAEDAQYGACVIRHAPKPVNTFGRVGDDAAPEQYISRSGN